MDLRNPFLFATSKRSKIIVKVIICVKILINLRTYVLDYTFMYVAFIWNRLLK